MTADATRERDSFERALRADEAYERYLKDLDSLEVFVYAQRGHASRAHFSRGSGWLKMSDRTTGELMVAMGKLALTRRCLLDVAQAIVRSANPHASNAEWCAKLFETARVELSKNYDDVERRSGPESVRHKDCIRPYTRAEKLIVLEVLHALCAPHSGSVRALGWAAQRCAGELDCLATIKELCRG